MQVLPEKLHEDERVLLSIFLTLIDVDSGHHRLIPVLVQPLLHLQVELTLIIYNIEKAQTFCRLALRQYLAT